MKNDKENTGGSYPYAPLGLCLPIATAIKTLGGGKAAVSKSLLAAHLKEDERSPTLAFKISAAKNFGLIDGRSDFILTDIAKRYFFPTDEQDSKKALLECLARPLAFQVIINRFDGSKLPPPEMIGNILHKEAEVPISWKDRVAGFFIRSAQTVGVLDEGGHLRVGASKHQTIANPVVSDKSNDMKNLSEKPSVLISNYARHSESKTYETEEHVNVWAFTQQGKTVRVETPQEITVELWKKLESYIKLLQPEEKN